MGSGTSSTFKSDFAPAKSVPPWVSRGTVPCLNGFRAIAILLVIIGHYAVRPFHPFLPEAGDLGVEMFFVISGFLITLLLLREQARTKTVSLKHFYIRRALRIFPAFLFFMLVMYVFQELGYQSIPLSNWIESLTYTTSIFPVSGSEFRWELAHTWSLSVEEHFYLIWPIVFSLFARRSAFKACVFVALAGPLVRALMFFWVYDDPRLIGRTTLGRMDFLAAGCALAMMAACPVSRIYAWTNPRRLRYAFAGAIALLFLSKTAFNMFHRIDWVFGIECVLAPTLNVALMTILIWTSLNDPRSPVCAFLNCWPMNVIGILSYSMYLWNQPLMTPARGTGLGEFPYNVIAFLAATLVSYWLIERPFLLLKNRFAEISLRPAAPRVEVAPAAESGAMLAVPGG